MGLDMNQEAFGVPGKVPLSRSVALLQLAQAKNPIYRLLAVKAAGDVEHDKDKRLNFYSTYVGEADPHILSSVIDGVANTETPGAATVLQSLQPAVEKTGDAKLAAHLQNQILRLNNKVNSTSHP